MKSKKTLVAVLGILGILIATVGVTYAFYSYSRTGTKQNKISSGSINFLYKEASQGISLNDAMPMTEIEGKSQNNYFEFTVQSKTSPTVDIPYDITVKRSGNGENMDNIVNVYLTRVDTVNNEEVETPVTLSTNSLVSKFSQLSPYTNSSINIPANEKALFRGTVMAGTQNYNQKYRLRMWIDSGANYITQTAVPAHCVDSNSETVTTIPEVGEANQTNCTNTEGYTWVPADVISNYPYQGKTYTLKVNVYGKGNEVGSNTVELRKNTDIESITLGEDTLTSSDGTNYTAEYTIPSTQTSLVKTITVATENDNATVTVERLTALGEVEKDNGIKRLSTQVELTLTVGTNNYRITVTPEDPSVEQKVYNLSIVVKNPPSFANDDWDTILANVIADGGVAYTPVEGGPSAQPMKEITMTIDGVTETYHLRVANTSQCTNGETSETACGFVIEFADIISLQKMNTGDTVSGGYPRTLVFTYLNEKVLPALENALPPYIKNVMLPTTVISGADVNDSLFSSYDNDGNHGYIATGQKLYLLSRKEITDSSTNPDSAGYATRRLDYYALNNNHDKKIAGTNKYEFWWTRNALLQNDAFGKFGTTNWSLNSGYNKASTSYGVSPAFRIGATQNNNQS